MSINSISGTLPTELGRLEKLAVLVLSSNHLSGTLPSEMGRLTNLQKFVVDDNPISGSLPTELGLLTQLEKIAFTNTHLTGVIPSQLCHLRVAFNLSTLKPDCALEHPYNGLQCPSYECCNECLHFTPTVVVGRAAMTDKKKNKNVFEHFG